MTSPQGIDFDKLKASPAFMGLPDPDKQKILQEEYLPSVSPSFKQLSPAEQQQLIQSDIMPILTGGVTANAVEQSGEPVSIAPTGQPSQPVSAIGQGPALPEPPSPIDYSQIIEGLTAFGQSGASGLTAGSTPVNQVIAQRHPVLSTLGDVGGSIAGMVGLSMATSPFVALPAYGLTREVNRQADQINSVVAPRTNFDPMAIAGKTGLSLLEAFAPGAAAGKPLIRALSGAAYGLPFNVGDTLVEQQSDLGKMDLGQALFNPNTAAGMGTDALLALLTGQRVRSSPPSMPIGLKQLRGVETNMPASVPPVQTTDAVNPLGKLANGGALQQRPPLQGSVSIGRIVPSQPKTIREAIQQNQSKRDSIHQGKVSNLLAHINGMDEFQRPNAVKNLMKIAAGPDSPDRKVVRDALRSMRQKEKAAKEHASNIVKQAKAKASAAKEAELKKQAQEKIQAIREAAILKAQAIKEAAEIKARARQEAIQSKQAKVQKSKKRKITSSDDLEKLANKVHQLHQQNRVNLANKLLRDTFHPNTVALVKDRVAQLKAEVSKAAKREAFINRKRGKLGMGAKKDDTSAKAVINELTSSPLEGYYEQPAFDFFDRYGYRVAKDPTDTRFFKVTIGGKAGTIRFKRGATLGHLLKQNEHLTGAIVSRLRKKDYTQSIIDDIKEFGSTSETGQPKGAAFVDNITKKQIAQRESEENTNFEKLEVEQYDLLKEISQVKNTDDLHALAEKVYDDKWDVLPEDEVAKITDAYARMDDQLRASEVKPPVVKPENTPKELTGSNEKMLKAGLKESGMDYKQAKALQQEVDALGNADSDPRIKKLKEDKAALGGKRDAETQAKRAEINDKIKQISAERQQLRDKASLIHPNVRELLKTEWDGQSPTAKQLAIDPAEQLKKSDVEHLVKNKKALEAIDSVMRQGLSGRGEFASEITGSTDMALKATASGNFKIPLSDFTPTHYTIKKKIDESSPEYMALMNERRALGNKRDDEIRAAKAAIDEAIQELAVDTAAVVGYNDKGHSRIHYFNSIEGSAIERFKPLDKELHTGVVPNVYLGPRDFKVADILKRPIDDSIGVLTSEARASAERYKALLSGDMGKLSKTGQGIINQLLDIRKTAGRVYSDADIKKMQDAALQELTPQQRKELYKAITQEEC